MIRSISLVAGALGASVFACSFASKLPGASDPIKDKTDGVASQVDDAKPDSPAGSEAPQVTASDDDPSEVRSAIDDLNKGEAELAEGDIEAYARISQRFNYRFHAKKEYDSFGKGPALKERLKALDAKAVAMVGGSLKKHYGDGTRVTTNKGADVVEAMEKAISLCDGATNMSGGYSAGETHATRLADSIKKYEESLERALRADKGLIVYVGDWSGGSYIDVPSKLMACEAKIAEKRFEVEDEYMPEEPATSGRKIGCGKAYFLVDGVQVGSNKFAPYSRTEGGQSAFEEIKCSEIPKKSKHGKQFKAAVKEFYDYNKIKNKNEVVIVEDGKPWTEESSNDYRLHRYQKFTAYSKKADLPANPCGKDEKLFCEAGGSKGARMFNRMQHHMARGQFHAGLRPDRCKEHLKASFELWEEFRDFRDDLKKSGQWIEGASYKSKRGKKYPEAEFVTQFEKQGKQADERALGDYCTKRQKNK